MIRICFCYNDNSKLLKEAIQEVISQYSDVSFEAYNEDNYSERKKSYAIKNCFAARMTPFCGVFDGNTAMKGFYSEVKECTEQNIIDYMLNKFVTLQKNSETSDSSKSIDLNKPVLNNKNLHNND